MVRNSAAISIAALIATLSATRAIARVAMTHWSGPQEWTVIGDAATFRFRSHETGAASILATDVRADGSVDACEG